MKKLMLAAVAFTLLGGCAHDPSAPREPRARDKDDSIMVGSNLRKKGPGTSRAGTASGADVEDARMGR
ncbi:hypothetical protein LQ564_06155 [Massilia sp. G4R7]|uniref:Lipoprotein n=1 Tax=Massilia phyllostachyos TaxID=2898585 RepID=A0ABS8Q2Z7_9BURK|nr:hypothetical protein [Massilia phyllostachyos]MCD2515898.1 hypothetical protein [Massilia phyllostachyos]